jgi:DNA-binding response OmpR family regulator
VGGQTDGTMNNRILIVDDEPNIVVSLEFLMRREGYAVSVARDGEEGLASIRAELPDLVLLDVMMPKLNGYDVCQQVRSDPALARIRIVLLTAASARSADVDKGLALGDDAYIPKPFGTRDLVIQVHSLLDAESAIKAFA